MKMAKVIKHSSLWNKLSNNKGLAKLSSSLKGELLLLRSSINLFLKKDPGILALMVVFTLLYWAFYLMIIPFLLLGLGLKFDWQMSY
jgi:hypothetical protein